MGVKVLEGTGTMLSISNHLLVPVKFVTWTVPVMKIGVLYRVRTLTNHVSSEYVYSLQTPCMGEF